MANSQCAHADLPPTGVVCPSCKKGALEIARSRFGPIYKCTSKECKFWLPERPTGKKCSFVRNGKKMRRADGHGYKNDSGSMQ